MGTTIFHAHTEETWSIFKKSTFLKENRDKSIKT